MTLKQIRRQNPEALFLVWGDGHEGPVPLVKLRDACPCAGCKGETVLLQHYESPAQDRNAPGRYDLTGAVPVGNYAIQFSWGDGHGEGIYTLEYLRGLCSCSICVPPVQP